MHVCLYVYMPTYTRTFINTLCIHVHVFGHVRVRLSVPLESMQSSRCICEPDKGKYKKKYFIAQLTVMSQQIQEHGN